MTLFDCPFNFFWPSILTIITALFKKDWSYRKAVVSNLQDANLKQSHERKKLHVLMCQLYMFCWCTRFSSRNLKDGNSFLFSWCITTSSLTICSWYDMPFSQFISTCKVWFISAVNAICKYKLCRRRFWIKFI